jgi:hypothetical protein
MDRRVGGALSRPLFYLTGWQGGGGMELVFLRDSNAARCPAGMMRHLPKTAPLLANG